MSFTSKIEWTESTWNPVTGCSKVSPGCKNCYAERLAYRLKAMGNPSYQNGFEVTQHERMLPLPYKWKKPSIVFVNSMSDIFHESVDIDFVHRIFKVMNNTPQHTYQVLTKRSQNMLEIVPDLTFSPNIWLGVTVESEEYTYRISRLLQTTAKIKFVSFEPLLGQIHSFEKVDWAIVGGESGPGARPMKEDWARSIRDHCIDYHIPFFFKQWGGVNKKKMGRKLDGLFWDEMPFSVNSK